MKKIFDLVLDLEYRLLGNLERNEWETVHTIHTVQLNIVTGAVDVEMGCNRKVQKLSTSL